jgi:hypothetical protein
MERGERRQQKGEKRVENREEREQEMRVKARPGEAS